MPNQALINYIKQNLAGGFSESEIRRALLQVGWHESEIRDAFWEVKNLSQKPSVKPAGVGFQNEHPAVLPAGLIILILLPILALGGFLTYRKYLASHKNQSPTGIATTPENTESVIKGVTQTAEKAGLERDQKRIDDIANLQTALEKFFGGHLFYPKTLSELVKAGLISQIPLDPKSGEPYLYQPLGDPALYYALSFIFEKNVGTLHAGLQIVSSELRLPLEKIKGQQAIVEDENLAPSDKIKVTDLGTEPFYPQEEVTLEVTPSSELDISNVVLKGPGLDLIDAKGPFVFKFSAPKEEGKYAIRVFAFAKNGEVFSQMTQLTVGRR